MIQLLGMQISLACINYYISNLYILSIAVCVRRNDTLAFADVRPEAATKVNRLLINYVQNTNNKICNPYLQDRIKGWGTNEQRANQLKFAITSHPGAKAAPDRMAVCTQPRETN
jgi:hypothetical protein